LSPHVATIATVAGQPISVSVLEERIALLRRGPRGRHLPPPGSPGYGDACRWVVRELVTEAVLEHEARARGLTEPSQLVLAVTEGVAVSRDEVRSYYDRNPDLYRRGATVIPFEEAQASIEHELLLAARIRAFDLWLEQRRQALAAVEPDYEHPADPSYGFPSHRH
jgi:[acyl-carrier-protein] S-malonyltransferase